MRERGDVGNGVVTLAWLSIAHRGREAYQPSLRIPCKHEAKINAKANVSDKPT